MQIIIKNMKRGSDDIAALNLLKKLQIGYVKHHEKSQLINIPFISTEQLTLLNEALISTPFFVILNKQQLHVESIKLAVRKMLAEPRLQVNYSTYLEEKLQLNYTYLAKIFSELEGITVEHFIIAEKIDKVKKLLLTGEKSLGEIADDLFYSSVSHLSAQFKKVTGTTPSQFKKLHRN